MVLKPLRSPCARGWVGGEKVILHNTSTFASHARSQCLCCFLPIIQCTFGAHQDVGLAQQPSPCRFVGTIHTLSFLIPWEDGYLWQDWTALSSLESRTSSNASPAHYICRPACADCLQIPAIIICMGTALSACAHAHYNECRVCVWQFVATCCNYNKYEHVPEWIHKTKHISVVFTMGRLPLICPGLSCKRARENQRSVTVEIWPFRNSTNRSQPLTACYRFLPQLLYQW